MSHFIQVIFDVQVSVGRAKDGKAYASANFLNTSYMAEGRTTETALSRLEADIKDARLHWPCRVTVVSEAGE